MHLGAPKISKFLEAHVSRPYWKATSSTGTRSLFVSMPVCSLTISVLSTLLITNGNQEAWSSLCACAVGCWSAVAMHAMVKWSRPVSNIGNMISPYFGTPVPNILGYFAPSNHISLVNTTSPWEILHPLSSYIAYIYNCTI